MRQFTLLEEFETNIDGRSILVFPEKAITDGEVRSLVFKRETILINKKPFKVIGFEDDLIPRDPKDPFTFMGQKAISFLVVNEL